RLCIPTYISTRHQHSFPTRRSSDLQANGGFRNEIVPVYGHDEVGVRTLVDRDQCVRPEASMESLAALPSAFLADGSVTAGNSSRSEEHTSELQSRSDLVCRLLLEKK